MQTDRGGTRTKALTIIRASFPTSKLSPALHAPCDCNPLPKTLSSSGGFLHDKPSPITSFANALHRGVYDTLNTHPGALTRWLPPGTTLSIVLCVTLHARALTLRGWLPL
jgi:hypothetical protein